MSKKRYHKSLGFGIDIGGSGIKGAPVDLEKGELADERLRIPTPQPATPQVVAEVVATVLGHFGWDRDFGCTFPAVVQHGVVRTAAHVDEGWIGVDAHHLLRTTTGRRAVVVNDADAAGVAEVRFGAAKAVPGVVLLLTLGTGIGSALFLDGKLVPNTELGHLELDGKDAETKAAASARDREELSWTHWAERVQHYLEYCERLFTPDLFVLGGGVSKKPDKWLPHIKVRTPVKIAQLVNNAGIVGAAMVAFEADGAGTAPSGTTQVSQARR